MNKSRRHERNRVMNKQRAAREAWFEKLPWLDRELQAALTEMNSILLTDPAFPARERLARLVGFVAGFRRALETA